MINLDTDRARLDWMTPQLQAAGLDWERVAAVRGDAVPEALRSWFFEPGATASPVLLPGEVGCYASHLLIMRRVVEEGLPHALVLEDDVELKPHLRGVLDQAGDLPEGWHIVRLSGLVKTAVAHVRPLGDGVELVRYSRVPLGTGAYLISNAGARRFLERPSVRRRPIDADLRRVWECRMRTYGVAPSPVEQDVFQRSSIDGMAARPRRSSRERKGAADLGTLLSDPFARVAWQARELGPTTWAGCVASNAWSKVSKAHRDRIRRRANGA